MKCQRAGIWKWFSGRCYHFDVWTVVVCVVTECKRVFEWCYKQTRKQDSCEGSPT
jgi:hypothetical protein